MRCMACKADEQEACPVCGFIERDFVPEKHHLPPRTILKGQYLVGCALGEGGFGITYIGWDLFLHMPVAIKEYFPSGVVIRDQGQHTVNVFAGKDEQSFLLGRDRFFREAQKVARFDNNPGVVSVKNCFLENGTAYIIMEYISGINLGTYAAQRGGKLGFQETLQLLKTPIQTLEELHRYSTYHRDISPENLMLSKTGTVKLIDFGSAMESDSEKKTRVLMVRSGYSPVEMYSSTGKDGPYSDVYSMAATIYKLITGVTPPAATERLNADSLVRPTMLGVKEISQEQEAALMKGMAVQLNDRYQTMAEFFHDLYGYGINDAPLSKPQPKHRTLLVLLALACVALLVGAGILLGRQGGFTPAPIEQETAEPTEAITAEPTAEPTEAPTAEPTETPAAVADAARDMPVLGAELRAFLRQNGYDAPDGQPIPAEALAKVGAVRMLGSRLYFQLLNEDGYLDWNDELGRMWRKDGEELDEERRNQPTGNTLDLTELSGCVNLQYLNLRDVWVSSARALENLPRVGTLILDNCGVTDDILPVLGSLASLDSLKLDNNALTTLEGLQALTNLQELSVACNQITSLAPIADLPIGNLNLSGIPIASLNELSGGKLVSTIFWFDCSPTAGEYSVLAEMKNLVGFTCAGSVLEERLPQDFSALANMRNLDYLYIANCQVKNLDFASDKPNLKTFELWDCGITSDMLSGIHDLPALEMLNLSYNRITYVDNLALETMPNLKTLYLNNNYIHDFRPLIKSGVRRRHIGNQGDPAELLSGDLAAARDMPVLGAELRAFLRQNGYDAPDGQPIPAEALAKVGAVRMLGSRLYFQLLNEDGYLDWNDELGRMWRKDGEELDEERRNQPTGNTLDLTELSGCVNLQYLNLRDVWVSSARALENLPRVGTLILDNCGVTDDILPVLGSLASLDSLKLDNNALTTLEGLQALTNLQELSVACNQITSLAPIADLPIGNLNLSGIPIASLNELSGGKLVSTIFWFDCSPTAGEYSVLAEMKNLVGFTCAGSVLEERLPQDFSALANMRNLDYLYIANCQVKNLDFASDKPNLKTFELWDCGITSDMLSGIHDLPALEMLNLSYNRITYVDNLALETMPNLKTLYLNMNRITGDQLSSLRDLPNIDFLDLSWNLITNIDGLALDKMPTLHRLRLNDNSIQDSEALKNIRVDVVYTMGQKDLTKQWLSEELRTALRRHLKLAGGEWVTQEQLDRICALTVVNGEVTFHTYDGEIDPNADMLEWLVSIQRDAGDYLIFRLEQLGWGGFSDGDFQSMSEDEFDLNQLRTFRNLRYFHLTNRKAVNTDALAGLPLRRLVMVNCGLTDADLVAIGQIGSISDLNLARNQITSLHGLEDHGFGYLGLAFNDVSDLSALNDEMNDMWGLDLSYNSGITSLETLPANLKESLKALWIAGLELDLTPLSELKSLEMLRLGDGLNGNRINLNLKQLTGATGLEHLLLVGAQADSLDFLKNLTKLKYLMVSNCGVTESMLPALNGLTKLEELWLENDGLTSLNGIQFDRLKNLRYLSLWGNDIAELPELNENIMVER